MRRYAAFDQIIEVEFRAFPAVWWLLAGFEVRIGDQVFHPRLDHAGFFAHPITEFYLVADGRLIHGMVRGVGHWLFLSKKRYSLVVGMSELARDTQRMRGWQSSYLAAVIVCALLLLAVVGFLTGGLAVWDHFHPVVP